MAKHCSFPPPKNAGDLQRAATKGRDGDAGERHVVSRSLRSLRGVEHRDGTLSTLQAELDLHLPVLQENATCVPLQKHLHVFHEVARIVGILTSQNRLGVEGFSREHIPLLNDFAAAPRGALDPKRTAICSGPIRLRMEDDAECTWHTRRTDLEPEKVLIEAPAFDPKERCITLEREVPFTEHLHVVEGHFLFRLRHPITRRSFNCDQ
mmetsp:Transcript_107062/g.301270  ORF Transcript_107062/g.301270 Transcript_107062/m.301270 type:complete len:208 (+) Transcript_107062:785-1408(+)